MIKRFPQALLCLFVILSSAAFAQTTSTITGVIQDQAGAVVPGVKLVATQIETGLRRTTISDSTGRYTFPEMRVGAYEVRAERDGFRTVVRQGIVLRLGEASVVDVVMEVSKLVEGTETVAQMFSSTRRRGS